MPALEPVPDRHGRVPVWDAAVRLLHAALAATVIVNLIRDDGDRLHRAIGYIAVGIVLMRLVWALVARGPARLAHLRLSWRGTWRYGRALLQGHPPRHLAHDPLGLWMVWLLWALVLLLGLTGWMSRLDAFWGDDLVNGLHTWLADILLVAVLLHLAGVAVMSWLWKENLPASMLTGRKRAGAGHEVPPGPGVMQTHQNALAPHDPLPGDDHGPPDSRPRR
ncbi:MAG: cytochrome b/b6 domain-containing protein [Rhizobacter sp.]|nr:cytochrome b/b6 domain-containing protein [Rhizobacter sp.]